MTTTALSPEWLDELCGWVRRPPGDLGPLGWPVVLMAERIDAGFARPADARTTYQRVRWNAAVPRTPIELEARTAWVAAAPQGTDIAIVSTASTNGQQLAESEVVVRTAEPRATWGTPDTPPVPAAGEARRRLSFALGEHDVAAFAALSGVHEPIHEDATYAWRLGHPNVLVQELTLLLIVMQLTAAGSTGTVEMWFLAPVPVGSMLTLWQGAGGAGAWEVRAAGSGRTVAVGLVNWRRPNG